MAYSGRFAFLNGYSIKVEAPLYLTLCITTNNGEECILIYILTIHYALRPAMVMTFQLLNRSCYTISVSVCFVTCVNQLIQQLPV